MKRNTQRQGGFTLVELLVVITIIGMLMALLLPAVNAAVEQARNITCKNNMRNVATACVSFESTNGRFPGYREWMDGSLNPTTNEPFRRGWTVAILPQLDHHDWFEEFRRQIHSGGSSFAFASELFVCPSNPPTTGLAGWSGYCINAGYWHEGNDGKPSDGLEIPADGIAHDYAVKDSDGIPMGVITTMDYISANDGSSYTVILSENVNQTAGSKAFWWEYPDFAVPKLGTTMVWHVVASPELRLINNRGDKAALQSVPLTVDSARPSSFHTGGVNMAFCDQRVIFVRETIAYRVYQHLMTPNGRESHMPATSLEVPLTDAEYN